MGILNWFSKEEDFAGKDVYDVELTESGNNKVKIIKVVREATGLGLTETKDLIDNVPQVVKTGAPRKEAEKLKKELERWGAKVTLR